MSPTQGTGYVRTSRNMLTPSAVKTASAGPERAVQVTSGDGARDWTIRQSQKEYSPAPINHSTLPFGPREISLCCEQSETYATTIVLTNLDCIESCCLTRCVGGIDFVSKYGLGFHAKMKMSFFMFKTNAGFHVRL